MPNTASPLCASRSAVKTMTEIILSEKCGFCFGVKRAVSMLEKEIENNHGKKEIYCIGEIIHNKTFIESIKKLGVNIIDSDQLEAIPENSIVFIRTHGVTKQVYDFLDQKRIDYVDATCPYVKKIHKIAEEQPNSSIVVIIGDKKHPEVQGICSFAKGKVYVYKNCDELTNSPPDIDNNSDIILVAQTTLNISEWEKCQKFIKCLYTNARVFDTICSVTDERQKEVLSLAKDSDLVIVVGGKASSNTTKLYQIAAENCKNAIHIETAKELYNHPPHLLKAADKIAITAGASTPSSIIQEVFKTMTDITNGELSFAEMLDESFKTLNTGERVTGTISAISPSEIHVDLGTKHTGILPIEEVTVESGEDIEQKYKVGDSIDVICIKFNDVEGTVLLSRKKLEQTKHWQTIRQAFEDKTILTGTVKDIIKGGLIVNVQSSRVFVPASHSGLPRKEPIEQLKDNKVNLKIIEINDNRKRAVGSIRNANRDIRRKEIDEFYETLEEGQKFNGTVRSLTSYGAFVNIGPVDGMVHITELSWGRLKPPVEMFEIGDKIDVYIKSIDPEKRRISLGYKTEENNPWNIFAGKYKVDDIIDVTVVSLMPFGAFAEIIPGVDGLIHNTQIAKKPVGNPASVLKIGDKVTVKITAIDLERSRVSLSIRALLEQDTEISEKDKADIVINSDGADKQQIAEKDIVNETEENKADKNDTEGNKAEEIPALENTEVTEPIEEKADDIKNSAISADENDTDSNITEEVTDVKSSEVVEPAEENAENIKPANDEIDTDDEPSDDTQGNKEA